MSTDKVLNPDQLAAINHPSGPLLIIAGAGTGKTTVITERVRHIISSNLASPEEILCLTFTEKAAQEMETRIDASLPYGYTQMWITTFHSFCDRILKDEALHIGLDPSFKLLSQADGITLLQRHLFDFPLKYYRPQGNPYKFLAALLQHFSRLQDEDVSPDAYSQFVFNLADSDDKTRYQELSTLYSGYSQLKTAASVMDFSDLITHTLTLFRTRPTVLSVYQQKFKFILVDEYQDTNFAQNQLVDLLAGSHPNLTVVADDDQAIYRWRGAAVSNVVQFRQTYPDSTLIVLTQNYRSTQTILDRSYALIQHNNPDRLEIKEGITKQLHSVRGVTGQPVEFLHFDRVDQEADGVSRKIQELLTRHPHLKYQDFAILVRANAHAEPFLRSLAHFGLPSQFLGPSKLYQQPEVKDLLAYLYVLNNFSDNASFYRLLSHPYFALPGRDVSAICNQTKKLNLDLFEVCELLVKSPSSTTVPLPQLSPTTLATLTTLITLLVDHLSQKSTQTAGQLLYDFLFKTGMLQSIIDRRPPFDDTQSQNIIKFFEKIKSYETLHPTAYVSEVVDWFTLATDLGESPLAGETDLSQSNAINLLTLHSAKGLEFPVVFLVNLVSQRFPTIARKEAIPLPDALIHEDLPSGDYHLQEERRLMYVGITRARDFLYLTAADYYGDTKRPKKLSPFIFETLGEAALAPTLSPQSQMSLLDFSSPKPSAKSPPSQLVPVDYLSYSQIQTFLDCPLHYKLKYILRLPTPPSAAASFGTTIHATLKDFYQHQGQADILSLYRRHWSPQGYKDKAHEADYKHRGEQYLLNYVEREFSPTSLPLKLEEPFTVPLVSPDGTRRLKIGGKMDRVDRLPDGTLEIVDYKTSLHTLDQSEADSALQLTFYALAASLLPHAPFHVSPDKIKLTLYYLDSGEKVTTTRTSDQLNAAIQEIFAYADQISHSAFQCSQGILCRDCEFKLLCSYGLSSAFTN